MDPTKTDCEELPPCLIHVDKEGLLWHRGAEMTHQGINRLLMDHVELDGGGRYIISFQGQRCYVDVEDTFFVVRAVEAMIGDDGGIEKIEISLNDGSMEDLDPSHLTQNEHHVLYTQVKNGVFPARFLRAAYYRLADFLVEKDGGFYLPMKGHDYKITPV